MELQGMFDQVEFGFADARNERTRMPRLLLDGFFDEFGYTRELAAGHKFLVLGPKGSGKSALGGRLQLLGNKAENCHVTLHDLEGFPFDAFTGVLPGKEALDIRLPENWEFILLMCALESLAGDSTVATSGRVSVKDAADGLATLGLLPSASGISEVVRKTTQKGEFRLNFAIFEGTVSRETESVPADTRVMFTVLKEAVYNARFEGEHRIILDNLDYVVTQRQSQLSSIAGLVHAADRLNEKFRERDLDLKVIVMCRSDLFARLPGPNNAKVLRDSSVFLDWYQDVKDPHATNIVKLVNLRGAASLGRKVNVIAEFLPLTIYGDPTIKVILENTRHIPRDIVELMNAIKHYSKGNPTVTDIENGLRRYSLQYFRHEIRDELDGFLEPEQIQAVFRILKIPKARTFPVKQLEEAHAQSSELQKTSLLAILRRLYDAGAVTNLDRQTGYYTSKYRNPYSEFDEYQDVAVHRGLYRSF